MSRRVVVASLALFVCALTAAPALAGSGTGTTVHPVEGQAFTGAVATYASTVTANERFIQQAYLDLLGRSVDPSALAFFDNLLSTGGTRQDVAQALLGTDEYRAAFVRSLFQAFLHRTATDSEVAFLVDQLDVGASDEDVKAYLLGSTEYYDLHGSTDEGFLEALFPDVLGRPIDSSAEAFYLGQLGGGATREQVALEVLTSAEARGVLVQSWFQRFLHRDADPADISFYSGLLAGGATDEDVMALIVGSAEYFADVPASFATAAIDWGDGSPAASGSIDGTGSVSGGHTYAEEGTYPISVVVTDLDGTTTIPATAAVADASLTAAGTSFVVAKKVAFTHTVATFTDADPAGTASDFTAAIDWGDGGSSPGTVVAVPGGFAVNGTHAYDAKGQFPIGVRISDAGGAAAEASSAAVVLTKGLAK